MIIGIYNHKGGVGKSTLTANLAYETAKTKKVCVIDLDGQCNSSDFFGVSNGKGIFEVFKGDAVSTVINSTRYETLDCIPCSPAFESVVDSFADGELGTQEELVERITALKDYIENNYDMCFVDFPPQFDTVTKLSLMLLIDKVLVVTKLTDINAVKGVGSINDFLYENDVECLGVVANCYTDTAFEREMYTALETRGVRFMNTCIHAQNAVVTAYRNGKCLTEMYRNNDRYPKRREFAELAREIEK